MASLWPLTLVLPIVFWIFRGHEEAVDDPLMGRSVIAFDSISPKTSTFKSDSCKVKQNM